MTRISCKQNSKVQNKLGDLNLMLSCCRTEPKPTRPDCHTRQKARESTTNQAHGRWPLPRARASPSSAASTSPPARHQTLSPSSSPPPSPPRPSPRLSRPAGSARTRVASSRGTCSGSTYARRAGPPRLPSTDGPGRASTSRSRSSGAQSRCSGARAATSTPSR